jgi:hypothetical protein
MSHAALAKYIAAKNSVLRLFSEPELNVDQLTVDDIQSLLASIENDLSPENLTCDGELRGAKLASKRKQIEGAQSALKKLLSNHHERAVAGHNLYRVVGR